MAMQGLLMSNIALKLVLKGIYRVGAGRLMSAGYVLERLAVRIKFAVLC